MSQTLFGIKLIVIFSITFMLIKLIIRYASTIGLVDIPNQRSTHKTVTPRGAGIGMLFGIILSDIFFLNTVVLDHITTFVAIFFVFIVGILDDHRDASPKTKFYVIFIAVVLLALDDIVIRTLGYFFGYNVSLGWFAIPFTMFAVVGFTNALNLSDGLDGLAGSLSIIILATLCIIGYENHDMFIVSTALSFIAAIIAFMWFNWNPATIFMGDSGSLTLGFVISILSIKSLAYIQPSAILFIAAIPILDTIIVMVRRKRTGQSMFSPDKLHLHHILLKFFDGNIRKTVIFIVLLQILYSLIGLEVADYSFQPYTLVFFILNMVILYILLNTMILNKNPFALRKKRRK